MHENRQNFDQIDMKWLYSVHLSKEVYEIRKQFLLNNFLVEGKWKDGIDTCLISQDANSLHYIDNQIVRLAIRLEQVELEDLWNQRNNS